MQVEQVLWPELWILEVGGAHEYYADVPDLLGRAGRRRKLGWSPLLVSACDTDRKGLLCSHSWGPGLQEERAKPGGLLSQASGPCGRSSHDAGAKPYGPPVES